MTKVALVVSSLRAGGAERVIASLGGNLADAGFEVVVITWDSTRSDFYPLDSRVQRVGLDLLSASRSVADRFLGNARRILALRRALGQAAPDVVISFVDQMNVAALLATAGTPTPIIVSERVDPRYHSIGAAWAALRRLTYPRAAAIVVQTEAAARWAREFVPSGLVHVIPNPVQPPRDPSVPSSADAHGPRFLAVGRLTRQKGFDLLMHAFARCRECEPEASLTIAGDGPDREHLSRLAAALGVTAAVAMPGTVRDIDRLYRDADVFVLSSRFEGFPNVLLEAMSHGCPPVAFDCPSGPGEIIHDGETGLLVPAEDVDALASAMLRLARNPGLRMALGRGAAGVRQAYAPERIYGQWNQLIATCGSGC